MNIKSTIQRLFATALFTILPIISASAFEVDGMSYQAINSSEVRLTKGLNQAEVIIPSTITYNGVTYTVTEIYRQAFYSFKNTRRIVIPGSVRTIGDQSFYDNYYLEEIELNEGLERIETDAFGYAFPLKEIRLPSTLYYIGHQAFITNRTNQASIFCYASTPPTIADNTALKGRTNTTLHVYAQDLDLYKEAAYWKEFTSFEGLTNSGRCYNPIITYDNYRLTMSCETEEASIYYTTDGSIPDETSIRYTSPFTYNTNLPIRAIAIADGKENSGIRSFNLSQDLFKTEATLNASLSDDLVLTISCEASSIPGIPEPTIMYRNAIYAPEWEEYIGPVKMQRPGYIEIFAQRDGWVATPTSTFDFYTDYYTTKPKIRWDSDNRKISITHDDPDVDIYYTLDGTDPSVETSLYTEPISISKNTEVKAFAVKRGQFDSNIASYKISNIITRFYVNGIYYQLAGNMIDEVKLDDGKNATGSINIPETITYAGQKFKIIGISNRAFYENDKLESISFSQFITSIGEYTFYKCVNLKEIDIPSNITSIGSSAFKRSGLNKVTLHEGLKEIGDFAFSKTDGVNHVIHQDPNRSIDVESLKEIVIPNSVTSIGRSAFMDNLFLTRVVLPEKIESIGDYTFAYCKSLTSINLPQSITSIGIEAFRGCKSLYALEIPINVSHIGGGAFAWCNNLSSIVIKGPITTIYADTFRGCSLLNNINLPASLFHIESNALYDCVGLKNLIIPQKVSSINKDAFYGCSSIESIYIYSLTPPDMQGGNAFENIKTTVKIYVNGSSLQRYKEAQYWAEFSTILPIEKIPCSPPTFILNDDYTLVMESKTSNATIYYTTDYSDPSTLSKKYSNPIPYYRNGERIRAIAVCNGYENSSVSEFGRSDFQLDNPTVTISDDCLVSIDYKGVAIPNLPVTLEYQTANGQRVTYSEPFKLSDEIATPNGLNVYAYRDGWIGSRATIDVTSYFTMSPTINISDSHVITITDNELEPGTKVYYTIFTYRKDFGYSMGDIPISDTILYTGPFTFNKRCKIKAFAKNNRKLKSFVTSISKSTSEPLNFTIDGITYTRSDNSLTNNGISINEVDKTKMVGDVIIPSLVDFEGISYQVVEIAGYAFSSCDELTSISLPATLNLIQNYSFRDCSSLKRINLPDGVLCIGESAFANCSSLTSISIPNSVTAIGNYAFSGCSSLQEVHLPDNAVTIGSGTFQGCSLLKSIILPNKLTSIGDRSFYGCSSLDAVAIPETVESIGASVFEGCTSLTSINLPKKLTELNNSLFKGCSILHTVSIPESVNTIGTSVFADCTSLQEVVLPSEITVINDYLFNGCSSLQRIKIPRLVERIGRSAFENCSNLAKIEIPNNVTNIDRKAFSGCNFLCKVILPESIETIESKAFSGCTNLDTIYCYAPTSPTLNAEAFTDVFSHATLLVRDYALDAYKGDPEWSQFLKIITFGATTCSSPVFSFANNRLTIVSETENATIYYTDDGTTPDKESTLYTSPILLMHNDTIRAIAYSNGYEQSLVKDFYINNMKVSAPVAELSENLIMTLRCAPFDIEHNPATKIYYQKNEKNDSSSGFGNWIKYEEPVQLTKPGHVRTIGLREGCEESEWGEYDFYSGLTISNPRLFVLEKEKSIILEHNDADAKIYYTLDGTRPTTESSLYTDTIRLTQNSVVTAIAKKDGYFATDTIRRVFKWFTVAQPEININRNIATITCKEPAETMIYYTLDNSNPTTESNLYKGPILLANNCNIKALAVADNWNDAPVASYRYRVAEHTCQRPAFSFYATAEDGSLHQTQDTLFISSLTDDAVIYYTLNGDQPTERSTKYEGGIHLTGNCTVKAIAIRSDMLDSPVSEQSIDWFKVQTPQIAFEGKMCAITTETEGAAVYYTIDESEPTVKSLVYNNRPFALPNQQVFVKAIAVKEDWNDSEVRQRTYNPGGNTCEAPDVVRMAGTDSIQMSSRTEGAVIYYTTNGVNPTTSDSVYTKPVLMAQNGTLKAMTTNPIYYDSEVSTLNVNWFKVDQPVITVEDKVITISCAKEGATIHYTLDGTEPTEENTVYRDRLTMTGSCVIKAIATFDNFNNSSIAKLDYRASEHACATPEFTKTDSLVTISCATEGNTTIYYTIDGSTPTAKSEVYTEPIRPVENGTIKAIAMNAKLFDSEEADYEVGWFKTENPEIISDGIFIEMACATPNSKIYYTLDGTAPNEESPVYSGRLTMTGTCTIKALAVRENFKNSAITTIVFDKAQNTVAAPLFQRSDSLIAITSASPDGTIIYYTVDGTDPATSSEVYEKPVKASENFMLKAIAVNPKMFDSPVGSYEVNWFKADMPVLSFDGFYVSMSCATTGSRIFYTLDGTSPNEESLRYSEAVRLGNSCTVKAVAMRDNFNNSPVVTASFDRGDNTVGRPQFERSGDTLSISSQSALDGTVVYYTTDGSDPTTASTQYAAPVVLQGNCTVKAIGVNPKLFTSETSTYDVNWFRVEAPVITFDGIEATISCETPNSRIYYTLDGTVPTAESYRYNSTLTMSNTCTIKAIAVKENWNNSQVVSTLFEKEMNTVGNPLYVRDGNVLAIQSASTIEGTSIYYTTDGSEPTTGSSVYTAPITLKENMTLKAFASNPKLFRSETTSYNVDWFKVETPVIVLDGNKVTISCNTPDVTIYYAYSEEPTTSSAIYKGPLTLIDNRTVYAYATKTNFHDSEMAKVMPSLFVCDEVTFNYNGHYLQMSTSEGSTIHYTLDGTKPSADAPVYTNAVEIEKVCTVRAIAMRRDFRDSPETAYTITYLYNGEEASLEEGGHLEEVFNWIGGADNVVTLPVKGKMNDKDLNFIRGMRSLRHLDLSEATYEGAYLPDEAFTGMKLLSFISPKQLVGAGEHLFKGCDDLAAIVWNANISVPETTIEDVKQNPNFLLYVNSRIYVPASYRGNLVSGGQASSITLTDMPSGGNFCCPQRFYTQQISYTHYYGQTTESGVARGWETLSLPFDVKTITHEKKGALAPFAKEADITKYKPFWLYELKETGFTRTGDIEAYKPYVISMPNNPSYADDYILAGKVTFSATDTYIEADTACVMLKGSLKFAPSMQRQPKSAQVMAINLEDYTDDEGIFYLSGSTFLPDMREVKPFEAYALVNSSMSAPMMISSYIWNDVNDIIDIEIKALQDTKKGIFDLSGRRLSKDSSVLNNKVLHRQKIYIIDGKKKLVK